MPRSSEVGGWREIGVCPNGVCPNGVCLMNVLDSTST